MGRGGRTFFHCCTGGVEPERLLDPAEQFTEPWGPADHGHCDKCDERDLDADAGALLLLPDRIVETAPLGEHLVAAIRARSGLAAVCGSESGGS